ncbi:DUF2336 domain-containing protein [Bradyrhizobium sp. WD16]|uniref:DUF2336 domain-containing protein n=1 Tax=Bradyrhizobium sp. WD16 TaxID=1521768 RepID=UPI0020A24E85|nr:DUF2336 domain-containing protein [Bradyrhizobium sp. WD16]UTD27156.1 hypothetical protein DB459_09720 [Bradyrhizobium sp. WD16]
MAAAVSALPELDEIVSSGDVRRQVEVVRKLSDLFAEGAAHFKPQHVELFDGILIGLVPLVEVDVRARLAEQLAPIPNAPPSLVGLLVHEDEIAIAGPILRASPQVDEPTLIEIASSKGQSHLFAITERASLAPGVTDVIIRRGDQDVVRSVASNSGARFSPNGYSGLITRASDDGVLALAVGRRHDINQQQLKELLEHSADIVRRRLFDMASPTRKVAINQAMIGIGSGPASRNGARDFARAQREILTLSLAEQLDESALLAFAKEHKYEETVAALSVMTGVSLTIIDNLMRGDRHDPILIMGKSLGLQWPTVRAVIIVRVGPGRPQPTVPEMEEARQNYERLVSATAQRVLKFWQKRPGTGGGAEN